MTWTVTLTAKARKGLDKLPVKVASAVVALLRELEFYGPVRGDWPNYGKLAPGRHHCHIKKGKPTYVAVWEERKGEIKLIEVVYVGTHEKAPY